MILLNQFSDLHQLPADSRLRKGVEFALSANASLPDGDIAIEGKDLYAKIMSPNTEAREKRFYETHRQYLDIHRVLEGGQFIEWLPRGAFPDLPYDAEKDVIIYKDYPDGSLLRLGGQTLAIFWPEDAHRPLIMLGQPARIKVCVVKVRVA